MLPSCLENITGPSRLPGVFISFTLVGVLEGCTMPTSPVPQGRCLKRMPTKKRASLVINLERIQTRIPCLVVDASERGFRLHGNFRLKRGQAVELILDEDPLSALRCNVVWTGRPGSKQEGQAGLEAM
jgi:PilZ domain